MGNKSGFYVLLPGTQAGQMWDADKYERNKEQLHNKYPDAIVLETSAYDGSDNYSDADQFDVMIPGQDHSQVWDGAKFRRNREKLMQKYPDAQITHMRNQADRYWTEQRDNAKAQLDEFNRENGAFLDEYEKNQAQSMAGSSYNRALTPAQEYVKANMEKYGPLAQKRKELEAAYFTNPKTIQEFEQGAATAKYYSNDYRSMIEGAADGHERRQWRRAAVLQDQIAEVYEAPNKYTRELDEGNGFTKYLQDFKQGSVDKWNDRDFWTRGLTEISRNLDLRSIAEKVEKAAEDAGNRELTDADIDNLLSPSEKAMLSSFYQLAEAQRQRAGSISSAYNAGGSFADSVGFMAEFILGTGVMNAAGTGLVRTAGKMAEGSAKRALTKWLGRSLMSEKAINRAIDKGLDVAINYGKAGTKMAKALELGDEIIAKPLVQGLGHTIVQQAGLWDNYAKSLMDTDENGKLKDKGEIFWNSLLDYYIENWSESGGEAFMKIIGAPLKGIGHVGQKYLGGTTPARFARWLYEAGPTMVFREAGFHGMFGETLEEWAGNAARVAFGLMTPEEFNEWGGAIFTSGDSEAKQNAWEQQIEMAASFAPLSLIGLQGATLSALRKSQYYKKTQGKVQEALRRHGVSEDEITGEGGLFNTRFQSKEELAKRLAPYLQKISSEEATPQNLEDYKEILNFAGLYEKQAVLEELENIENEGKRNSVRELLTANAGKFWNDYDAKDNAKDKEGNPIKIQQVHVVKYDDGRTLFLLGKDEASGEYAAVTPDGKHTFVKEKDLEEGFESGDIISNRQMMLDDYLQERVDVMKKDSEAQRMHDEKVAQMKNVRQRIKENPVVNIGTKENPVLVTIDATNGDGVHVHGTWTDVDGIAQEGIFTWKDVANYLQTPIDVKTDEQLDEEAGQAMDARDERVKTINQITPGTELTVNVDANGDGDLVPVKYKFEKAVADEDQISIYARDESGEVRRLDEDEISDLEEVLAVAMLENQGQEEAVHTGDMVDFIDAEGNRRHGMVSSEDNGGGVTTVRDDSGMEMAVPTANVSKSEQQAPAPVDDGVLRDFRGNEIPVFETGANKGKVNQNAFMNKDPEAWAVWNDEQQHDGGADSKQALENSAKTIVKRLSELQSQHDALASPGDRAAKKEEIAEQSERLRMFTDALKRYEAAPAAEATQEGGNASENQQDGAQEGAAQPTPEEKAQSVLGNQNFRSSDEAMRFINGRVAAAKKKADEKKNALDALAPEDYETEEEVGKAREKLEADYAPLKQELEYWYRVQAAAEKLHQQALTAERRHELELNEPKTIYQLAANVIKKFRGKISRDSVKAETGWGRYELSRFMPLWGDKKSALTINQLVDEMMDEDARYGLIPADANADKKDSQEARNALLEVLMGSRTAGDVFNYTHDQNLAIEQEEAEQYAALAEKEKSEIENEPAEAPAEEIDDLPAEEAELSGLGASPIGNNRFGDIYQWVTGKAKEAVDFLLNRKSGYLRGVFHRDGFGDIDMAWGDEKGGLFHIIKRHIEEADDFNSIEEALAVIEDVIANGTEVPQGTNLSFDKGKYRVSLAQGAEGSWLLTAFDKTRSREDKRRNKEDSTIGDQGTSDTGNGTLVSPQLDSESKDNENSENASTPEENSAEQGTIDFEGAAQEPEQPSESTGKLTEEQRQAPLLERAAKWKKALGDVFEVLTDISQVTDPDALESIKSGDITHGWFNPNTKKAYLYLPHISTTEEVDRKILHEVLVHKGFEGLFKTKEEYNQFLDTIWKMMENRTWVDDEGTIHDARDYFLDYVGGKEDSEQKRREAADEYLAHSAERYNPDRISAEQRSFWNTVLDILKRTLNDAFAEDIFFENEHWLEDMLMASYRQFAAEKVQMEAADIRVQAMNAINKVAGIKAEYGKLWGEWLKQEMSEADAANNRQAREALTKQQIEAERKIAEILSHLPDSALADMSSYGNYAAKSYVDDEMARRQAAHRKSQMSGALQALQTFAKVKAKPLAKFNINSYLDTDEKRPLLGGVFHDGGFAVASDAQILVADKESYDKTLEGKVINKKGEEVQGKYPNWRALLPEGSDVKTQKMNFSELRDFIASVRAEYDAKYDEAKANGAKPGAKSKYADKVKVALNMGDNTVITFYLGRLSQFADYSERIGAKEIIFVDERRAIGVKNSKGIAMLMPISVSWTNEDDLQEAAQHLYDVDYRSFGQNEEMKRPAPAVQTEPVAEPAQEAEPEQTPLQQSIEEEAAKVNANPTEAQKEAGNYQKGHIQLDGFNITIETAKGTVRRGTDQDGKAWETEMHNNYGYIRMTEGVDGDHVDVFLSDNPEQGNIFVVDQVDPKTGKFDEHKVMYGFGSVEEAKAAYLSNYEEGWQGLGNITEVTREEFKKWIDSSHRKTKPFAEYSSVKTVESTESSDKTARKSQKDHKIDDFGEHIAGARKDAARAKIANSTKLSIKDLKELKDPDKILSRKQIIKYYRDGQMTKHEAMMLLAANNAARGYEGWDKGWAISKYRDLASAWEQGQALTVEITEEDIEYQLSLRSERVRQLPQIREQVIKEMEFFFAKPVKDYFETYREIDYPAVNREVKTAYIRVGSHDGRFWVVASPKANRGWVFDTFEKAIAKFKATYPEVVSVEDKISKSKKDKDDKYGGLSITKDTYGLYRVRSSVIPGNIYLSGKFGTKAAAQKHLDENLESLKAREERMATALMGSNIGMVEREGADYRHGRDITEQDFMDTFGPRGVQFGNWVPQAERQEYLNKSYDAIMDFCMAVGISPKAFFLGGKLSIAFGARGKAKALAHYEPMEEVINLTRMKGAGSLAHEWFHALDNYLAKRVTGNITDMATQTMNTERQELADAFREFVTAMNRLDYTARSNRAGDYWGSVEERAARLFADYIYNTLGGKQTVSPLLARTPEGQYMSENEEEYVASSWPYATKAENETMRPYFDKLFQTLQEGTDSEGRTILFSRKGADFKQRQFDIIQRTNPMLDDIHTGIRSPKDILTLAEAVNTAKALGYVNGWDEIGSWPDVENSVYENALKSGMITVYSSKPISNGTFVGPSRIQAEEYAGGGEVYSKRMHIDDIAWIDTDEGQVAELEGTRFSREAIIPNTFITEGDNPFKNEEDVIKFLGKGGKLFHNAEQDVDMRVSRHTVLHSNLHFDEDNYAAFTKIDEIVKNASKIGEQPVAQDEIGKTNSVSIYYAPVNVFGRQYSARLLVKEYVHRGKVIEELGLYTMSMHKEKAPSTNVVRQNDGTVPNDSAKSGFKVKDLIHKSQIEDQRLLGITDASSLMFSRNKRDSEYLAAVEAGDMAKAQQMVNEAAKASGYISDSDYQGSLAFNGAAPSRNGYFETREERKAAFEDGSFEDTYSLGDFMEAGIDNNDLQWQLDNPIPASARDKATLESIKNLSAAVNEKKKTITMYRAVPSDVKEESFRNGDWVTPSRLYAEKHIELQDWEGGRIIEQEVSVDDIWWNGDDINEWGYDDGLDLAYKNTQNNRKLLDPVTYDDSGNVIPLSERFNSGKEDIRFSRVQAKDETKEAVLAAAKEAMPNTKVVDKYGNPRVVYHGTISRERFNEFNKGDIYMVSKPWHAEQYTHVRGTLGVLPDRRGRVMPVFVNLENPLIMDANRRLWRNLVAPWPQDGVVSTEDVANYAREHGYDGVIIKNVRDNMFDDDRTYADDIIAFDSSQVKSAGPTYQKTENWHYPWETYDELVSEVGNTYDDEGNVIPLSERFNAGERDIRFSRRTKPAPKKTGIGYKVFFVGRDGKLYPPMVANPGGADTPIGVWLDADAAPVAGTSKTGRPKVKAGGKGTQGGSGTLAYRPGWHLGEIPYAIQFNRLNPENGKKELFPREFVWAEVEYAADKDYQKDADAEGMNASGKYQHSLAGLKRVPEDGFYRYRTNPNPETDPWIITGAMKVNRVLNDEEVADLVRKAGREPQKREPENTRFSRAYHGSIADFNAFDINHAGEGEGFQSHGFGHYVAFNKETGTGYAWSNAFDYADRMGMIQPDIAQVLRDDSFDGYDDMVKRYDAILGKRKLDAQTELDEERAERVPDVSMIRILEAEVKSLERYRPLEEVFEGMRNIYTIEIPEDNGENYLNEQETVPESIIKRIYDSLQRLAKDKKHKELAERVQIKKPTIEQIYGKNGEIRSGGAVYDGLSLILGSPKEASKFLKGIGIVGIKYNGRSDGPCAVIFSDEDLEVVEHLRFSRNNESQKIFISNAEAALERVKMEKATPEQWLKMLEKEGGLKAGEDKWLGLSDWLKASDRKTLTKDDVAAFIRENEIQIEEVDYAESVEKDYGDAIKSYQKEFAEIAEENDGDTIAAWEGMIDRYGDDFEMAFNRDGDTIWPNYDWNDELVEAAIYFLDDRREDADVRGINPTRLNYTTEGLKDNREIALTVPSIEQWNEGDRIHFGDAGEGRAIAWIRFGDAPFNYVSGAFKEARAKLVELERKYDGKIYRNPDMPEEDVAERDRLTEIITGTEAPRRKKVLFIDEIQSKRHQEGREKGYRDEEKEAKIKEINEKIREIKTRAGYYDENGASYGRLSAKYQDEVAELIDEKDRIQEQIGEIPPAPFEKNWHELAMKRMLRLAAEEGYDYVAWTTGEQQAQRYNLSKVIKEIECIRVGANGNKQFSMKGLEHTLLVSPDGIVIAGEDAFKNKPLSDVVGKEVAVKMMASSEGDVLEENELKIGGEGMKRFYDEILPRFMNKYGKKWGVKVEDMELPLLESTGVTAHAVRVTDEMRESVMEGQLMFSKTQREKGPFGTILHGYEGRSKEAIQKLIKMQEGEAIGALSHPDIGAIDLVWGEAGTNHSDGYGLAKLVKFHPDVVDNLQEILNDMHIVSRSENRINLESDKYKAAVRLTWDDQRKTWLLTVFEKKNSALDNTTDTAKTSNGSERNDTATPQDTVSGNKGSENSDKNNNLYSRSRKAVDAVDSDGIGGIVGADNVRDFYRGIYEAMPEHLREAIVTRAENTGWNFRTALREHISDLAAKGFQNDETGLLRMVASILQGYSEDGAPISDKALEYILWRQGKEAELTDLFDMARGSWMRHEAENDKEESLRFSRSELSDQINTADAQVEATADAAQEVREEKKKALKGDLLTVAKAMAVQKEYDRSTVDSLVALAKGLLKDQDIDRMSRIEIARIMGLVQNSVGKSAKRVKQNADALINLVVDHLIKSEQHLFNQLISKTGTKVNTTGVEVQGELDVMGQNLVKAYKAALKMPLRNDRDLIDDTTIEGRMNAIADKLDSKDETVRKEAEIEYMALGLALEYKQTIEEKESEEVDLINELKDASQAMREGALSKTDYLSAKEEIENGLRENRIDQIEAYRSLRKKLEGILSGSIEAAAEFREKEKTRVEEIRHLANSDLEGMSASAEGKPDNSWLVNNPLAKIAFGPLATFDQILRLFGRKNVRGEGYLWSHFIKRANEASNAFFLGQKAANEEMDAKVSEIFGRKMKWSDLYKEEGKQPTVTVKWYDAGEMKEHELTQGNLLYIYMVNKMTDGRMKLRKMGITDEIVQAIARQMDPRFLELADWMQSEFLVKLRNKYNAIHEREFGASMAAIEDYFPLRINKRSLSKQEDVAAPDYDGLPSTATGAIIKRRRNSKPLDLLNADAFSVLAEHVDEMEKWAAYVGFSKDVNALLSYPRFKNRVLNMATVYGAGSDFWQNFTDTARLATGNYHPKTTRVDKGVATIAKGVTAAKVSFRLFTAEKQLLSLTAFIADANPVELAKSAATPWMSWNWAMDNLPAFEKRWKSRIAGDPRLMDNDSEWKFLHSRLYKAAQKLGMTPNAFIDALTVSIGAKAMYDTRYKQYIQEGFSEEKADEKAKLDATVLFNETQQSSEGAFVSTMQMDRTVGAIALSVYRNSSMGFQRQLHDALRGIGRHFQSGYREQSIEFMTKQLVREGLTEELARAAAERRYRRSLARDAVRAVTLGFAVQFAWNLGKSVIYLIFGDDDDKKKEMFAEAAWQALLGGSIEGLAGGNLASDLIMMKKEGKSMRSYDPTLLPLISDAKRLLQMFEYDEVAAWNEVVNLGVQIGLGVNLQTLSDAIVAIVDACDGDLETSREAMYVIMRVMEVPQSQLDELYIDELGMSGNRAKRMSTKQLARRYAEYKMMKNAPVTGWAYPDELEKKRRKSYEKKFEDKVEERKDLKKKQ